MISSKWVAANGMWSRKCILTWNSIIHCDHGLQKPGFTFCKRQEINNKTKQKISVDPVLAFNLFSENWIQLFHSVLLNAIRDQCWPWHSVEYQPQKPVSNIDGVYRINQEAIFFFHPFTPMKQYKITQTLHIESPRSAINSPVHHHG